MTFIAYQAAMFLYAASHAIAGTWAGATLKELSVGWGPLVWKGTLGSWPCVFRLLPMGASTAFYGEEDVEARPSDAVNLLDIPVIRRSLILLVGPATFILLGACLLLLPVFLAGPQVVVDNELTDAWPHSGVPGLAATKQPSTVPGQLRLFQHTAVVFTQRIMMWQSLEGWGGYIGWLTTCATAAQYSLATWSTCFGAVILWLGCVNLVPIVPLNGGHFVFNLLEGVVGRRLDSIRIAATYIGMLFCLHFMVRLVMADALWLGHVLLAR